VKEILMLSDDFTLPVNECTEPCSRNRGRAHLLNYDEG
jgi:hypothetical protein